MKYESSQLLKDLDGEAIKDNLTVSQLVAGISQHLSDSAKREFSDALTKLKLRDLTFGRACANALVGVYNDEQSLGGAEKLERMELAIRVLKPKFKLTTTEKDRIKNLVAKMYGPIVVGPVWAALDGTSLEPKEVEGE